MNAMPPPPRRLPVWLVVRRSYAYAWESRHVLAAPYLIYAVVTILVDVGVHLAAGGSRGASAVGSIIDEVFGMAFAVAIQRYVLLGEAGRGSRFFLWDQSFLRYLVNALLLSLAVGMTAVFLASLFLNLGGAPGVGAGSAGMPAGSPIALALALLIVALAVALGTVVARLMLTLPAAALGESDRVRRVWSATMGNGLRLFATAFLVALPFSATELVLLLFFSGGQGQGDLPVQTQILIDLATGVVAPLQLIVFTIMLALDYDALIRGGGPPAVSRNRNIRAVN